MKQVSSLRHFLPFRKFVIQENSMAPTYRQGNVILVKSWFNTFNKNNIIVFTDVHTGKVFIKRIVKITSDDVWVEGDNKKNSIDSRIFGPIKMHQIIGKVIAKL